MLTILKARMFKEKIKYSLSSMVLYIYLWVYGVAKLWSRILLDSSQVSNQQDATSRVQHRNTVRFFPSDGPS